MSIRRSLLPLTFLIASSLVSSNVFAQQQINCAEAQKRFDSITSKPYANPSTWTKVQQVFGTPHGVKKKSTDITTTLQYVYSGCSIKFFITNGRVSNKTFELGPAALIGTPSTAAVQNPSELTNAVDSLQATVQQLQAQISHLQTVLEGVNQARVGTLPSNLNESLGKIAASEKAAAPSPTTSPLCAENGSCYGDISSATGNPKTVPVKGYFRKDGTYVRGHYRSRPRR